MKNAGVILHTHVTITAISPQWRLSSVPHAALSLVALITRRIIAFTRALSWRERLFLFHLLR